MKRVPDFPPKVFHRIRPTTERELDTMIKSRSTAIVRAAHVLPFGRGHGLVVAGWDGFGPAKVEALGVVVDIDASGKRDVAWSRVQFDLPPSELRGAHFWQQPTFKFATTVAESFRLKQFFVEHVTDPFAIARGTTT